MAKNRRPQTIEKRRRERDKQEKRMAKLANRLERNAAKREVRRQAQADAVEGDEAVGPPEEPNGQVKEIP